MAFREKLGKLIRKHKISIAGESGSFLIRGLTVSEYIDLSMQGISVNRESSRLFTEIAYTGIVGYEGFEFKKDNRILEEFDPVILDEAPISDDQIIKIGKRIYYELTTISDEEREKFKGWIRFLHFASDSDNKQKVKNYDCRNCLEKGLAFSRKCGKFSDEEIQHYYDKINDNDVDGGGPEKKENSTSSLLDRYRSSGTSRGNNARKQKMKDKSTEDTHRISGVDFEYPECPISWLDEWQKELTSILHDCKENNMTFFNKGVAEEPYKLYSIARIVSSESSQIKQEELEEESNN